MRAFRTRKLLRLSPLIHPYCPPISPTTRNRRAGFWLIANHIRLSRDCNCVYITKSVNTLRLFLARPQLTVPVDETAQDLNPADHRQRDVQRQRDVMGTSTKRQTWPHNNPVQYFFTRASKETDRGTSDAERCPQHNQDNESRVESSAQSEFRSLLLYAGGNRVATLGESLSIAATLRPQAAVAPGRLFEAQDSNRTMPSRPEDGAQWVDFGSPNTEASPKLRTTSATSGGTLLLVERNDSSSVSDTPSGSCSLQQDDPDRGRRKEGGSIIKLSLDTAVADPPERTLSPTYALKPKTRSSCYDYERESIISVLIQPPSTSPRPPTSRHPPFRVRGMRTIRRITELASLLLGYILTVTVINSCHPDNGWLVDLPLVQLLPSSFTRPSPLIMLLQFMSWSLIGIFHLLQSPRYWPECGLIANAVSIAVGAWFGLRAMLDSLIITAFISLLVAKTIEWVSESRATSGGGLLPLSEQDRKHLAPVSRPMEVRKFDGRS